MGRCRWLSKGNAQISTYIVNITALYSQVEISPNNCPIPSWSSLNDIQVGCQEGIVRIRPRKQREGRNLKSFLLYGSSTLEFPSVSQVRQSHQKKIQHFIKERWSIKPTSTNNPKPSILSILTQFLQVTPGQGPRAPTVTQSHILPFNSPVGAPGRPSEKPRLEENGTETGGERDWDWRRTGLRHKPERKTGKRWNKAHMEQCHHSQKDLSDQNSQPLDSLAC